MPKLFEWHWHRFDLPGLPVTMPALPRTKHFRWAGIYGVQIGPWFVGAVKGQPGEPWEPLAPGTEAEGQDAKRLGAEHDGPVGNAEAP